MCTLLFARISKFSAKGAFFSGFREIFSGKIAGKNINVLPLATEKAGVTKKLGGHSSKHVSAGFSESSFYSI